MMLIDTTVLIDVLRDGSGGNVERLLAVLGTEDIAFTRFTELETLMGARDDTDWTELQNYFQSQTVIDPHPGSWSQSAKIYYDLRRSGRTVRSIVDCCIAQITIEQNLVLLHNDRDYEVIANVRPLQHVRLAFRSSVQDGR